MTLSDPEIGHFKSLLEELLFLLKSDESFVIADLEDQVRICAEILGMNPNVEQEDYGY